VCNRRSAILSTLGDIEFDHRSATCFGWWMQVCMLQSSNWAPYLKLSKLSVAADQIDRLVFYRRLLSRVDALVKGIPRFTKEGETALRQFAQDAASFLVPAFDLFEQYVNEYCNFSTGLLELESCPTRRCSRPASPAAERHTVRQQEWKE